MAVGRATALLAFALVGCAPKGGARVFTPEPGKYYAELSVPCGESLMKVAESPNGPFLDMRPVGPASPLATLRQHVLLTGHFVLYGRPNGQVFRDPVCGDAPELVVERFEPWPPIQRCTSLRSPEPELRWYTGDQPQDRLVPSDFRHGPEAAPVDASSCIARVGSCVAPLVSVEACDGRAWCCALAAMSDRALTPAARFR